MTNATDAFKSYVASQSKPVAPKDPRTMVSPVTGQSVGVWTGKVVSR